MGATNVGHVNLAATAARGTTTSTISGVEATRGATMATWGAGHTTYETTTAIAAGGTDESRFGLTILVMGLISGFHKGPRLMLTSRT